MVVVMGLLVLSAACGRGGGGGGDDAAANDVTTSTTVAGTTTVATGGSTSTTAASAGATTTTAKAATPAAEAAKPAAGGGPAPLAPGTYRYRQQGSATAGTQKYDSPKDGTLVAKAAGADGTQLLQRYIDPKSDPSDVTMRFGADGMFMLETVLRTGGQEVRCTFDDPMAAPSWPPAVGRSASGHADCDSFQLDVTSKITGTKPVTIDGAGYTAYIVESTSKTTGSVTSTGTQTDWFVPELRMATHTETSSKGSFGTFAFSSEGSADLVSAKPA
ncbi:MAG: hypothetical protein QOD30_562 [Actinomycetota bacterium]|nr:hypothetical protein [Actinomycetota bacterium]